MASDFASLKSSLNSARIASQNNALFQTILGLIDAVVELDLREPDIPEVPTINVLEIDTTGPSITQNIELETAVTGFLLVKDIAGNASVNNITLIGTVEGAVDPVISTNFGYLGVFRGLYGEFFYWVEKP